MNRQPLIHPSTFSIAAYCPQENAWGVAVASKFLAVGAFVPYACAGAGAVATQSYVNTTYGPRGLDLMAGGLSAEDALERLIAEDEGRDHRQVGLIDAQGRSATFTGSGCYHWAGGITGPNFACQGNILVSQATVEAMAGAFSGAGGELADRLVAALAAGEAAGGDSRGRQSAAVLVVKPGGGYAGFNDRYLDLRVDDHENPVRRLGELVEMHHLYFGKSDPAERLPLRGALLAEMQAVLVAEGLLSAATGAYDDATRAAFAQFTGRENLEERCDTGESPWIDPPAMHYIRERFGGQQ